MRNSIPVRISPMFWVSATLIGFLSSWTLLGTIVWIGIIFISILFHEYGHALAARYFGQFPRIELVAFGGLTYPEGPKLSLGKEFIVVLCGPLFSFFLCILGSIALKLPIVRATAELSVFFESFRVINLFWTIINLFPVLPLDGGQLLRIALEGAFGVKGLKLSMLIGVILSFIIAAAAFFVGWFFLGAIFFLFGFQNTQTYRLSRPITEQDRNQDFHLQLISAEKLMLSHQNDEAIKILEDLKVKTKAGILFITTSQHLARLYFEKNEIEKTYKTLIAIEGHLSDDFTYLMHFVSFEMKDYKRVFQYAEEAFRRNSSFEVAEKNALAAAFLLQEKAAFGWIEARVRESSENAKLFLSNELFHPLSNTQRFNEILNRYSDSQNG